MGELADLGLAYALEYPGCVQRLVCLARTGMHNDRDICPPWSVRQLAELLPEGRFAELPGAGHYAWLTHGPQLQEALACALKPGACPRSSPTSP